MVCKEVNRRIGTAKGDFLALQKVWKRSACTWPKKVHIFNALIESKLLYSLSSLCLTVAEKRRLDGFQNRCLPQIIGIKPSFISRVSNATVLDKTKHAAASRMLEKRQLQLLGKMLKSPEGHPLRTAAFVPTTLRPQTDRYVRRIGRPSKEWVPEVLKQAWCIFGGTLQVQNFNTSKDAWNNALFNHFGF